MSNATSLRVPKYRLHKAKSLAVVTLNGRDRYLGKYGTAASREEYRRLIAEWCQRQGTAEPHQPGISVAEVMVSYLKFAERYYWKNGKATREYEIIRDLCCKFIRPLYGRTPAADFGPLRLKAIRQLMVDADHCRGYINKNVDRIRRMFTWAAGEELIPASVPHDFTVRLELPDKYEFLGKPPEGADSPTVFTPADEVRDTNLPAYIPAAKKLKDFTFGPAIVPDDVFLPLIEGKSIYHYDDRAYAYVSGGGSWVVTRPLDQNESDLIPHYFLLRVDVETRTPTQGIKVGYRDVSSSTDERTMVAAPISSRFPCNHKTPVFVIDCDGGQAERLKLMLSWFTSLAHDFLARVSGGGTGLFAVKNRPAPSDEELASVGLLDYSDQLLLQREWSKRESLRAAIDAIHASLYQLTPAEYAYILSTFPLLDRDQPPLPHDYRIRETNKGTDWRQISFITRDLALLTYFDYLAGRLDVKPDPERVKRICPEGVPEPPDDIVEFFAEAGVDIGCATDYAVAATGPYRNLRERVALARELGAVAYVPTIDRRRATFVEQAAAAGGLSPEEGVLSPEMAERVLRDKAERDAKWQRAMELWEKTPDPRVEHDTPVA